MRHVEVFSWWRPPDIWNRKRHLSKFKLSREDAARMWPGAEPDLSTREVREVPDHPMHSADEPLVRIRK